MRRPARPATAPKIGPAVIIGAAPSAVAELAALEAASAALEATLPAALVAEPAALVKESAAELASASRDDVASLAEAARDERAPEALAAASEADPDREPVAPAAAPMTEKRVVEPMVEVATEPSVPVDVVTTASVENAVLEAVRPDAAVESAVAAPPEETPAASQSVPPYA